MGKRGGKIGHGLLCHPGGIMEADEEALDCILREVLEEAKFPLPEWTMRRALKLVRPYTHVSRDPRARFITFAHHFDLGEMEEPDVEAADDLLAGSARFITRAECIEREAEWVADHFYMNQQGWDARQAGWK